ncbi:dTTP/UTP pyrophosphatase-like [Stegodyphus dumicola]|uniref:dTTP/UTP pyrophosphatase-like n=1 Tax=Stegodyphus dumicola TaxID=202533 RepID=UPI0015A86980|nr:dTTP/UTP pyrophosphatase-like [Stegodyphus dumicola]
MLKSFITHLNNCGIVLASKSSRRKRILEEIVGLKFEIFPSRFEENLELKDFSSPGDFVMETAKQKALAVAAYLEKEKKPVHLVIGADTVVIMDGEAFGKPEGNAEALGMLERLSGRTHEVMTGVALILPLRKGKGKAFVVSSA